MTDDEHLKLQQEHDDSHKSTLKLIKETDQALQSAQEVISKARKKLEEVTKKYEERLHGPKNP